MRIRSIKPEFYRSEDIAALSRECRGFFIGLWSYVDDNGVGIDDYRQIAADLYALDEDQNEVRQFIRDGLATLAGDPREGVARVSRSLASVAAPFLIVRYEVDGRKLFYITGWDRHQRVDRPHKPRYPRPPIFNGPPTSTNGTTKHDPRESVAKPRESVAKVAANVASGTEEQGNRGTEEQRNRGTGKEGKPLARARSHGREVRATADLKPSESFEFGSETLAIVEEWIKGLAHRPPSTVIQQVQNRVRTLFKEGIPEESIQDGMVRWAARDGAGPGLIPNFVHDAMNGKGAAQSAYEREVASWGLATKRGNGWTAMAHAMDEDDAKRAAHTNGEIRAIGGTA